MALEIRRVVTGHDAAGRALVEFDGVAGNVQSRRPGHEAVIVWTSEGFPADNNGHEDEARRPVDSTLANGSVFRIVSYGPGCAARTHRTDSIDYAVVLSGGIDLELDGTTVHLEAGDVLVQRGTIHNWLNSGAEPCVIAFVLIGAKAVEAGNQTLHAQG